MRFDWLRIWAVSMAFLGIGSVVVIAGYLLVSSLPVLTVEGVAIISDADWSYRSNNWGAAAMLFGTAIVALIALLLAVPVGVGTALYISEIAGERARIILKSLVELLAGIPSVVYGLLGIAILRPAVLDLANGLGFEIRQGDTLLTAGILLALMILPTVTTFSEDALSAVPRSHREASRGLGLTRVETIRDLVLPRAAPGILAAILLGLGRAAGETIAVFMVVGRADNRLPALGELFPAVLEPGQTITSKLGGSEINIAAGDPVHTGALMSLALLLFVGVVSLTMVASSIRRALGRRLSA